MERTEGACNGKKALLQFGGETVSVVSPQSYELLSLF